MVRSLGSCVMTEPASSRLRTTIEPISTSSTAAAAARTRAGPHRYRAVERGPMTCSGGGAGAWTVDARSDSWRVSSSARSSSSGSPVAIAGGIDGMGDRSWLDLLRRLLESPVDEGLDGAGSHAGRRVGDLRLAEPAVEPQHRHAVRWRGRDGGDARTRSGRVPSSRRRRPEASAAASPPSAGRGCGDPQPRTPPHAVGAAVDHAGARYAPGRSRRPTRSSDAHERVLHDLLGRSTLADDEDGEPDHRLVLVLVHVVEPTAALMGRRFDQVGSSSGETHHHPHRRTTRPVRLRASRPRRFGARR